nr:MAG TPA: hypothetical protein [Bacteriophage sp.]
MIKFSIVLSSYIENKNKKLSLYLYSAYYHFPKKEKNNSKHYIEN